MNRRAFFSLVGGAALAHSAVARAQQAVMPVIGFLSGRSQRESTRDVASFRDGLNEMGMSTGGT